ncbi:MAG: hypothetical protein ACH350_08625 [Parachlamydiaceae bacterium]
MERIEIVNIAAKRKDCGKRRCAFCYPVTLGTPKRAILVEFHLNFPKKSTT